MSLSFPKRGGCGHEVRCAGNLYVSPFYRQDMKIISYPIDGCKEEFGFYGNGIQPAKPTKLLAADGAK